MQEKKENFIASKLNIVIRYGLFLIVISLIISLSRSIIKLTKAEDKIQDVKNKIISLKKGNEDLNNQISRMESDFFIEKEARDKLGLAKKGEIVLVLPPSNNYESLINIDSEAEPNLPLPNYKKWLKIFNF